MPNIVSELAPVQANLTEQGSTRNVQSNSMNSTDSNESAGSAKPVKLPYQASHQVELLHLQAEIDALLQQLQNLKQQRLASDSPSEMQDSELHALV